MTEENNIKKEKQDEELVSNDNVSQDTKELQERAEDMGVKSLVDFPSGANKESIQILSEEIARKNNMAVFSKDEEGKVLHVAMLDPQDINTLNMLRFIAQKDRMGIEIYLTTQEILYKLLALYGSAEEAVDDVVMAFEVEGEDAKDDISVIGERESLQDAPVAKLVHVILKHALDGKASDIHIEPIDKTYRVRFRQDGILHSSLTFPLEVGKAVISRIKILSNLKIDEKRKPQDGRFRINDKGNDIDFRVSSLPVVEGEKIVMRVLEKDRQTFDLKELGMMGTQYDMFMERIMDPFGMILITGPTGSGKSTTLYAFLKILNGEERNIITLEDPVEYFVPGINQSQVKPEIGYTFASGLRSILRQDPNVIMVGEIRDGETAELGVHAALTGHLVFSTVHTNNAVGALPRLIDLGIEPFLIASAVRVIAAQRLVRKICEHCKEEITIPDNVIEKIKSELVGVDDAEMVKYGLDPNADFKFHHGKGCKKCGKLGLVGRLALYEAIDIDREMQDLITEEDGNMPKVDALARRKGYITLKQDGILKMLLGLTTLTELERVTEGDMSIGGKLDEIEDEDQMHKESGHKDNQE
ncbi:MAG: GspE/PulE family protein [Candidatus Moraniibacteriota bacterium]|jgi:type IV pilus assembly protein PilB